MPILDAEVLADLGLVRSILERRDVPDDLLPEAGHVGLHWHVSLLDNGVLSSLCDLLPSPTNVPRPSLMPPRWQPLSQTQEGGLGRIYPPCL